MCVPILSCRYYRAHCVMPVVSETGIMIQPERQTTKLLKWPTTVCRYTDCCNAVRRTQIDWCFFMNSFARCILHVQPQRVANEMMSTESSVILIWHRWQKLVDRLNSKWSDHQTIKHVLCVVRPCMTKSEYRKTELVRRYVYYCYFCT